ncbi:MAG TPA: flagellar basal body P-ring formation chaperone FlgA [Xanthobacteraceae bacterium]|nr:flagellar basal body P-ring formation chaperone FlgA [Xanthobacteraceae bacterium]
MSMLRIFAATALAVVATGAPADAQISGALPQAGAPAPFADPTLKRSVVVTGDLVRIGDLIDNAGGAFATIPVFRSPDVGTTGTVPARTIVEAARAHNLFGVKTGEVIEVEVTRAGRVIAKDGIEARIARLFAGTNGLGAASDLSISFDRAPASINADLAPDTELKAMRASYDARTGRFDVVFDVPVGTSRRSLLRYTGSLVETADAVVPIRAIGRGEIVRGADLVVERRPRAEVTADVPASIAEVAGRAARQGLRPGRPVRRTDLAKPELVKRDDTVSVIYQVPGMMLTSRAKALEGGGEGDIVNVLNPQSKRAIQGVVIGPGRVDISPPTLQAAVAGTGPSADEMPTGPR